MNAADGREDLRDAARDAFVALRSAMQEAATTFGHNAVIATSLIEALDREPSITAVTSAFPVNEERNRLMKALDEYEARRREARLALWRLMQHEGCSIGEISRIFGLSRQLVSRQMHGQPAGDPPRSMEPSQ
jgi:DNA-directed RNA polymerase specialized sigma24 family protein